MMVKHRRLAGSISKLSSSSPVGDQQPVAVGQFLRRPPLRLDQRTKVLPLRDEAPQTRALPGSTLVRKVVAAPALLPIAGLHLAHANCDAKYTKLRDLLLLADGRSLLKGVPVGR